MISNFKKTPQNDFDLMQQTDDSIPRVYKVTDHVYVAVGFALANMIMIEGTVRYKLMKLSVNCFGYLNSVDRTEYRYGNCFRQLKLTIYKHEIKNA